MERLETLREASLIAANEARSDDGVYVVGPDESHSEASSFEDDIDAAPDDALEAYLNVAAGMAHECRDATDSGSTTSTEESEQEAPFVGPQPRPKPLYARRCRTTTLGRVRKEPPMSFKVACRCKWRELTGDAEFPPTLEGRRAQVNSLRTLREFASTLHNGSGYVIHRVEQVMKWPDSVPVGHGCRKRSVRSTDPRRFEDLDRLVLAFLRGRREGNGMVQTADLLDFANKTLQGDRVMSEACGGKTSVSPSWIHRFMKRTGARVRRVKKRTELTAADVCAKVIPFYNCLARCGPHVDAFVNFDEVPISLSGKMGALRTVTVAGDDDVRANINANDQKRCATLVVAAGCKRVGDRWEDVPFKPIILLKGTPVTERIQNEQYDTRVIVTWTPKSTLKRCVVWFSHIFETR